MATRQQDILARTRALDALIAEEEQEEQAEDGQDVARLLQNLEALVSEEQQLRDPAADARELDRSAGIGIESAVERIRQAQNVRMGRLPSGSGTPTAEGAVQLEEIQGATPVQRDVAASLIADPSGRSLAGGDRSQGNAVLASATGTELAIGRAQAFSPVAGLISGGVETAGFLGSFIFDPLGVLAGPTVREGIRRRASIRMAIREEEGEGRFVESLATDIFRVGGELLLARRIPGIGQALAGAPKTVGTTVGRRIASRAAVESAAAGISETTIGFAETGDLEVANRRGAFGLVVGGIGGGVVGGFVERAARRTAVATATRTAQASEDAILDALQTNIQREIAEAPKLLGPGTRRSEEEIASEVQEALLAQTGGSPPIRGRASRVALRRAQQSVDPTSTPPGFIELPGVPPQRLAAQAREDAVEDNLLAALRENIERDIRDAPLQIPARTGSRAPRPTLDTPAVVPDARRGTGGQIDLPSGRQSMRERAAQLSRSRGAILAEPIPLIGPERQLAAISQADELVLSLEREALETVRPLQPDEILAESKRFVERKLERRARQLVREGAERRAGGDRRNLPGARVGGEIEEAAALVAREDAAIGRVEVPVNAPEGVDAKLWATMTDQEREAFMRGRARREGGMGGRLFIGGIDPTGLRRALTARSGGALLGGVGGAQAGSEIGENRGESRVAGAILGGVTGAVAGFIAGSIAPNPGRFFRRNFTVPGLLPEGIFTDKVLKDGRTRAILQQIRFTTRQFNQALKEAYGSRGAATAEELRRVDQVLKGEIPETRIPAVLRSMVKQMRGEIDDLSQRLIDDGIIEGDLAARVSENRGFYTTRAYQVFDNPNWQDVVDPAIVKKARAYLRGRIAKSEGLTGDALEERVEGEIRGLLDQKGSSPLGFIRGQQIGSKDLSILRKRGDIAPEIRALWGEYKDPIANYTRSVEKMARLVENDSFLRAARVNGMGTIFFNKRVSNAAGDFIVQISAKGNARMEPLDGLFTTAEIAQGFEDAVGGLGDLPQWLRPFMAVNSIVKFSKTIGSLMTHVRNTVGNVGFAVANGHLSFRTPADALLAIRTTFAGVTARGTKETQAFYKQMQELAVINESANVGEINDAMRDVMGRDVENPFSTLAERTANKVLKPFARAAGGVLDGAQNLYRAEDDVWKIYAFLNEQRRLGRALPDVAQDVIDARAAEIVRNTYPTYSLVPRGIKALRRVPLVGTFVSFPAEVARVGKNTVELAFRDLADPNPAIKLIGAQRLAGIMVAGGGTAVAAARSRFLNGITDQEDEDVRSLLPPWSQNSQLFYTNKTPDGRYEYIDISYSDPFAYLKRIAIAGMRGESIEQAALDAGIEALKPFLDEEILAGKLLDIARNRRRGTDNNVFNPEDSWDRRLEDIFGHIWDAVEPGTWTSIQRIQMGLDNEQTIYGQQYDPKVEAMALFTGQRRSVLDPVGAMQFKTREFISRKADANRIFNREVSSRGSVTDNELELSFRSMLDARVRNYRDIINTVNAVQRLGSTDRVGAFATLRSNGVSAREAAFLVAGRIPPMEISDERITNFIRTRMTGLETGTDQFTRTRQETEQRLQLWRQLVIDANRQQLEDTGR